MTRFQRRFAVHAVTFALAMPAIAATMFGHAKTLVFCSEEVVDFKLSPFGRHTFYGIDSRENGF